MGSNPLTQCYAAAKPRPHAPDARMNARNERAPVRNNHHLSRAGYFSGSGDLTMRMLETAVSSVLALAAQALVVGVVATAL